MSILHDLVSFDSEEDKTEIETKEESPRTSSSIRDLRRRHASKSVYLEIGDDPIKPGDLKRTRPLSLPPGATLNEAGTIASAFEIDDEKGRIRSDLRKYGLTRTRSFNRKHRNGAGVLSGSSSSVTGTSDAEKRSPTNIEDEFDMLERRLSIISDDDNTSSCIKNTLRKVSQAFSSHGSDQKLDTARAPCTSTTSLTADIDAFLAQDELWKTSTIPRTKRRSLGSIISETINPSNNLDGSKKRAFSTSVINEVSIERKDEELEKRLNELDRELDMDAEFNDKNARFNGTTRNRVVPFPKTNFVEQISYDSQFSNEGIEFTASMNIAGDDTTKPFEMQECPGQDSLGHPEPNQLESTSDEKPHNGLECTNDEIETAPKRPAAPSSLNYVRSFAASIRRYRKNNVEISESKSVYDRIREYTALVSKEKHEQKGKTVDEILESLDTVNLPLSAKYIDNRRKFTRMASVVGEEEKKESVLSAPHVWFDTKPSKEAVREFDGENTKPTQNRAKRDSTRGKTNVTFDKAIGTVDNAETRPFSGISAVLNSWRNKESNTLPRRKAAKAQNKSGAKSGAISKDDWKKSKSRTVDENVVRHDNNNGKHSANEDTQISSQVDGGKKPEGDDKNEAPIPVKDLVKQYHQQVIVAGEKEVEEMLESKLRRSKKKKEREKMKTNLQRKLSLRRLDVEEEETDKNKLNRSVSCESVQRGTVKQLISLFNVSKQ